ncbi:hypothetical protein SAMN04488137_4526 [Fictibacillus solisalsi]|uniref:Uncharacterized protein n=1 Tax=Fictibacillus solisalsi TaxID=459525 RepID=A0A1H0BJY6_9BACL|nr:hypothetical protein [Fictibacillus solisalsi]SDN45960.1 hypothetical protein SAMN04488137_4526 [Fictibacillus solisalsi]
MSTVKENSLKNLMFFYPYLGKSVVISKLNDYIKKFPNFNQIYTEIRKENKDEDVPTVVAKTLIFGVEENIINDTDLDELLFLLLEDSLLNSFLYKLDKSLYVQNDSSFSQHLLKAWGVPSENKILSNVNTTGTSDFIICGFRESKTNDTLESLRILLIDRKAVDVYFKNDENKQIVFPTIIEFDLRRSLLHIRLKDVDNIVDNQEKFSTMSGRINNTLNFIDSLYPEIHYSNIKNFRSSLYLLEENLLQEKRDQAYRKLKDFEKEISNFTNLVTDKFNPPTNLDITPKEYISNGVLSVISTTLNNSELGDVVGIKFRNSKEDNDQKYAEITISDKGFNCISTNNLYWLNLPVLQSRQAVEFLKIVKSLPSGLVIVNLDFSLDTANVRLMQRSKHEDVENKKPNQEKYDDTIDFLNFFIK